MQTPHTLTSKSRRSLLNYWLYLPPEYEAQTDKRWPLLMFLHGFGERGDSLEELGLVKSHGPSKLIEQGKDFPFIVVSPQCSRSSWWTLQDTALKQLIDETAANYRVDVSRIYMTGLSMGGYGSWHMGIKYPETFAAIAPICGGGNASDVYVLKNVPVWTFHGAKDDVVLPQHTQDMVNALQKAGGNVRLTVYPEADHDSWTVTYANPELYEWFLTHQRTSTS